MSEERDAVVARLRGLLRGAAPAHELGRLDDEVDALRERFPTDLEIRLWCDVAEVRLRGPERAWEVLGGAARAYAAQPHLWTRQQLVLLLRSAPDRLVERFEAAALDPGDLELLGAGGEAFGQEGRFELASRWFERVLARDPAHLRARTLRIWVRWLLTMDPREEEEMRALAAEHPDDETIALLLGEMTG